MSTSLLYCRTPSPGTCSSSVRPGSSSVGPGSTPRSQSTIRRRCTLVAQATPSSDREPFDAFTARAVREAVQLLKEAQALAEEQTRSELFQSWQASESSQNGGAESSGCGPTESVLQAFWEEQGLNQHHAARLSSELQRDPVSRSWSLQQLAAKLSLLQRILPDSSIAQLAYQHHPVLQVSSQQVVQVIVTLLDVMPEGTNVIAMLEKQPKLLCSKTHELTERLQRVLGKLVQLHPSADRNVVAGMLWGLC